MEFIASRGFKLPEAEEEFAQWYWYNLWRVRLWPYRELVVGDLLYWYEGPSKCIVWKTRVAEADRFAYDGKSVVRNRLEAAFGSPPDADDPYFANAPERGYCLAYRVQPIERVDLPKPEALRFPQHGWLRAHDDTARQWLRQPSAQDDVTLDDIATLGGPLERLRLIGARMAEVAPERVRSIVSRTVRRDSQLVQALKEFYGFRCQFPGCGVRIAKRGGGFYAEVAHVEPVHKSGQSVLGNLLVLCPTTKGVRRGRPEDHGADGDPAARNAQREGV